MMSDMRLFVCLEPSADAVEQLDEFLDVRRGEGPELRWAGVDQWHVTLAFMGSAPPHAVDEVVERVSGAAERGAPLTLSVAGGGCFPDVTRAKVLWAGIEGSAESLESLRRLAGRVRSACSVAGAGPEGGAFVPHLTLGRFPRAQDASRWVRLLQSCAGPPWVASHVTVVASHPPRERGHRPRHQVLARLPLGG